MRIFMKIAIYLRASTIEQNVDRAFDHLHQFVQDHGHTVTDVYKENLTGTTLQRPELKRMLDDLPAGSVIVVEELSRLSRLPEPEWNTLKFMLHNKGLRLVVADLPTTYAALNSSIDDSFTGAIMRAINSLILDIAAATVRKDWIDRKTKSQMRIDQIKADPVLRAQKYKGKQISETRKAKARYAVELKMQGRKAPEIAEILSVPVSTVYRYLASVKPSCNCGASCSAC